MVVFDVLHFSLQLCCFQSDSALFLCIFVLVVSTKTHQDACKSQGHRRGYQVYAQNAEDIILLSYCFMTLCDDNIRSGKVKKSSF